MSTWDTRMYGSYNRLIQIIGRKAYIKLPHTVRVGDILTNGTKRYTITTINECKDHTEADLEPLKEENNDPQRVSGRSALH